MADKGIFINVAPALDMAALSAVVGNMKRIFQGAGAEISKEISAPTKSIKALEDQMIASANRAADARIRAAKLAADAEVAEAKRGAVAQAGLAKAAEDRSAAELAAIATIQNRKDKAAQAAKESEQASTRATAAADAHTAALSKSEAAGITMGSALNGIGLAAVGGLGFAMAETTGKAADFQTQMTKLTASAGESFDNIAVVSQGILQMAGQVGYSTKELSDGMYLVEKAGFRGADGLKVLQAAAEGAGAEQADLKEVINGLTTSMTDFGVAPDKAADLMSKMVTAVGQAKTTFQDFAGALHSVEPAAAQAHLKLEDVWGTLAQVTQSGTSPLQASQNMAQAITSLSRPNSVQAKKMQQLGINPDDVSQHLADRGLAGSLQFLQSQIAARIDPSTKLVDTGELTRNAGALSNLHDMINDSALSEQDRAAAQAYFNGQMGSRAFTMVARKADSDDSKKLEQIKQLTDQVNAFSQRVAGGRDTLETMNTALGDVTGTAEAASIAMQTTGKHAGETADKIKEIASTTVDADGHVKGFAETQETLNGKLRDVKAGFGAVAIEAGDVFVPVLTHVANGLKTVADFMSQHKGIAEGLIYTLGGLTAAWVTVKAAMLIADIWNAFKGFAGWVTETMIPRLSLLATEFQGLGPAAAEGAAGVEAAAASEVTAVNGVTAAAGVARSALLGVGALAAGVVGYTLWADQYVKDHPAPRDSIDGANAAGRGGLASGIGKALHPDTTDDGSGFAGIDTSGNAGTTPEQQRAGTLARQQGRSGLPDEPVPALPSIPLPALPAMPAAGPAGGGGGSGKSGSAKKTPEGSKSDPLYTLPADALTGQQAKGGPNPWDSYNPLQDAASGGFSLPNIARMGTTFLAELALGNPLGRLQAKNRGGDASNPVYVQDVSGGAGGIAGLTRSAANPLLDKATRLAENANGLTYQYGGVGDAVHQFSYDCSGFMSDIYSALTGQQTGVRRFDTESDFTKLGFRRGFDPNSPFNIGVHNGGGGQNSHMAGTLNGVNVEAGGSDDKVKFGGKAAGALNPEFENHYYLPAGSVVPSALPGLLTQGGQFSGLPAAGSPLQQLQGAYGTGGFGGQGAMFARPGGNAGGTSRATNAQGTSPGFGLSGGVLGAAEGAASAGANAFAPGAGAAVDIASQEANRFAGYLGQLGGIAAEGLMETFTLNDSPIADPSKNIFGKIAFGLAGAHPTAPNSAGQTAPKMSPDDSKQGDDKQQGQNGPMVQTGDINIQNGDYHKVTQEMNRGMLQYANGNPV